MFLKNHFKFKQSAGSRKEIPIKSRRINKPWESKIFNLSNFVWGWWNSYCLYCPY